MTTNKRTLTEQIAARLNTFNARLEAKLSRRQKLLEKLKAEEDFEKSMGYLKEFFRSDETHH